MKEKLLSNSKKEHILFTERMIVLLQQSILLEVFQAVHRILLLGIAKLSEMLLKIIFNSRIKKNLQDLCIFHKMVRLLLATKPQLIKTSNKQLFINQCVLRLLTSILCRVFEIPNRNNQVFNRNHHLKANDVYTNPVLSTLLILSVEYVVSLSVLKHNSVNRTGLKIQKMPWYHYIIFNTYSETVSSNYPLQPSPRHPTERQSNFHHQVSIKKLQKASSF